MMNMKRVGAFIRTRREKLGLSQEKLAEYLEVPTQKVAGWENGEGCPEEKCLRSMTQLFVCEYTEVINGGFEDVFDMDEVLECDVAVTFDRAAERVIPSRMFGDNLEHTRGGINGGLSAQMLQNRKFVGKPSRFGYAHGWYPIGNAYFFFNGAYTRHAEGYRMNRALECNAQAITSYDGTTAGIGQGELCVKAGKEYEFLTVVKAFEDTELTVRLVSESGTVYDEKKLIAEKGEYAEKSVVLCPDTDDRKAKLEITFAKVGTVWFGTLSLMPKENFRGMRLDVIECMKDEGIKLLRWPGGNFAGEYSWRDGLLPREMRAPLQSYMWLETQPHTWGYDFHEINVDDFVALCREIGAEPFVTINPTWDTPEGSAQWVEYCNGDETTEYGKLRMERGFKEPYNIKLWSLGNEFGYGHMEGANTPEGYAKLVREHAVAMLNVSPELEFCSSGPYPSETWAEGAAKALGDIATLVSLHHYAHYPDFVDPAKREEEYYTLVNEIKSQFRNRASMLREQLGDDRIKISFDEWNAWYAWYRRGSVAEAIMAASFQHMIFENAEKYGVAQVCHFESVNEGAIQVYPDYAKLSPTGKVFSLMKNHAEGRMIAAQQDALATEKDGIVTCTLINRSYDKGKKFTLEAIGEVSRAVLCSSEDVVSNTEFTESELKLTKEGGCFETVLPAHSIALVAFKL